MKVWRFARGGNGWFVMFVDEIGCVSIQSDYGDYAYRWSSFGDDIRKFLLTAGQSYLTDKFTIGHPKVVRGPETIENFKTYICEWRRNGEISKEKARDLFDVIPYHIDNDFELGELDIDLKQLAYEDPDIIKYGKELDQINAFFEECWPEIRKQLKESINVTG